MIAFLIGLLLLYPSTPSVSTTEVKVRDLSWETDAVTGSITANFTLSVSVLLENDNRFGAYFNQAPIDIFMTKPIDTDRTHVGTLMLPEGYIGSKSSLHLIVTGTITNAQVASTTELVTLSRRLNVSAESNSTGHVTIIGLKIPWSRSTQCAAVCTVNLWTMEIALLQQTCDMS